MSRIVRVRYHDCVCIQDSCNVVRATICKELLCSISRLQTCNLKENPTMSGVQCA